MRAASSGAVLLAALAVAGCRGAVRAGGVDRGADAAVDAALEGGAEAGATRPAVDAGAVPDDVTLPAPSGELATRARHLVEALAQDDPALAADILFPRDAWLAMRDATDPGKEWDREVSQPFQRAVHALARHQQGASLGAAEAVSIELGHVMLQAATRKHGWKKPAWSVRGSRLTFVVDGHARTLPIREMTAWRGAWYVTRLR